MSRRPTPACSIDKTVGGVEESFSRRGCLVPVRSSFFTKVFLAHRRKADEHPRRLRAAKYDPAN